MSDNISIKDSAGTTKTIRTVDTGGAHYSAIVPADSSGNLYTPNAISQKVTVSTSNSNSSTLATGLTWTGTGESTLNCAGIQVNLENDQACTVTVYQSQDNSTWTTAVDAYTVAKSAGLAITVQATASYVKVAVKNDSTGTLTYKLQTVFCPVVEAVPRSLTTYGNFKSSIEELHDIYGFNGMFTPFRDLKVCEPYRLIGASFGSSNDTNFWTVSNSGAASGAAVASGIATLTSGTANSGYGHIVSVRAARFMSAHPHLCRINARVTNTTITGCTRRWGAATLSTTTPQEAFYFELSGAGALSVVHATGGTPTSVASGSFNGDVPEYVMDTNVHTYEIVYVLMGVKFYIDGVLIHSLTPTTARLTTTLNLDVFATSINSASGTASGVLELWSGTIVRLGRSDTMPTSKQTTGVTSSVCKLGVGSLQCIVISNVSNGAVVTIYDNTTATGTVLWTSGTIVVAVGQNPGIVTIPFPKAIPFYTGLSIATTVAAANVLVAYE